jgi:hypothetical protein
MSKELDKYLKNVIKKVPEAIQSFLDDKNGEYQMVYYVGNWQDDVLNNFTQIQADKIFAEMRKFQDQCYFFQKKVHGLEYEDAKENKYQTYEYQVRRF